MMNEDDFLDSWLPTLKSGKQIHTGPGDDCAAVHWTDDTLLLLATDQVIDEVHYDADTDPALVGRKLLARNLSDIAAMGGKPLYALLSCAIPDEKKSFLEGMLAGLRDYADANEIFIIGGDLARADQAVCSLTIAGEVARDHICLRKNAKVGQQLFVTGSLGNSLASGHHLTFEPRLQEGQWLAGQGIRCMMDISDGLVKDLPRLAKASQCGFQLDLDAIPKNNGADLEAALSDGEDYELIFTSEAMPQNWPFDLPLTCIGSAIEEQRICDSQGETIRFRGFEHWS